MDTWPVQLQQKLNSDNFSLKLGDTTIRSDMDVGPAKVRSRFTDAVDTYDVAVFLDIEDKDTLLTFYKTTLNNGVLQFLFDDPFTGTPTAFRFATPPALRAVGGRLFELTMSWEKLP